MKIKKKELRKSWRAYQFFEEEGYEDAVISYLKKMGIGYKVKLHDGNGKPVPERRERREKVEEDEYAPPTTSRTIQGSIISVGDDAYNVIFSFQPIVG